MMAFISMRRPRALLLFLTSVLTSCSYEYPKDLRLESVYLADCTELPGYKFGVEHGVAQRVGLIIEVSTSDNFSHGVFVVDGFCGERLSAARLGDGMLYRMDPHTDDMNGKGAIDRQPYRHRYFVHVVLVGPKFSPPPDWPAYNLNNDHRAICLNTASGTGYISNGSNQVQVSRDLIEQARRTPPRPNVPPFYSP